MYWKVYYVYIFEQHTSQPEASTFVSLEEKEDVMCCMSYKDRLLLFCQQKKTRFSEVIGYRNPCIFVVLTSMINLANLGKLRECTDSIAKKT